MPAAKPVSQHILAGTYRADRHGRRASIELGKGNAKLKPPPTLHPSMRPLWRKVVATLEPSWLSNADAWTLSALIEALSFQADAAKRLRESGTVVKTPNGDVHKSPFWMVWRQSMDAVMRLSVRFGLSPGDRARLIALAGAPESTPDASAAFEQLMQQIAVQADADDEALEGEEW